MDDWALDQASGFASRLLSVTCNRGGVVSQNDQPTEDSPLTDVDLVGGLFAGVQTAARRSTHDGLNDMPSLRSIAEMPVAAMASMTQLVREMRSFVAERADAEVRVIDRIIASHHARAEAEVRVIDRRIAERTEENRTLEMQLQLKRQAAGDDHVAPMAGRRRRRTRPRAERYDLSAKVLRESHPVETCTPSTVYPIVRADFDRRRELGRPLDVQVTENDDGLPVVHALCRPHEGYLQDTASSRPSVRADWGAANLPATFARPFRERRGP